APIGRIAAQQLHLASPRAQNEVARELLAIVEEVLADQVAAVAETQDEFRMAEVRVIAHEVPQDRPMADIDQRLWNGVRVLPEPSAEAPAEKHDFHEVFISQRRLIQRPPE